VPDSLESKDSNLVPFIHRYRDYESNLSPFLLKLNPRFTAPKAYQGRERLVKSFISYYESGGQKGGEYAFGRWKVQHDAGMSTETIARLEATSGLGLLANSAPTSFWTVFDIYSRPELLIMIREEVRQNALHVDASSGLHILDLTGIGNGCNLLLSAFQETLRLRAHGPTTRMVTEDLMLNGQYLIKAGSILQMPSVLLNRNDSVWKEKPGEFIPERFQSDKHYSKKLSAFLSFGTTPRMCPGRHFATAKILALAAMLVLRYDLTPETGRWITPELNPHAMGATVNPPLDQCRVQVTQRSEYKQTTWAFRVTDGKGRFSLITG
jgi:hypothetical protein